MSCQRGHRRILCTCKSKRIQYTSTMHTITKLYYNLDEIKND